jgi:hypothetical protein
MTDYKEPPMADDGDLGDDEQLSEQELAEGADIELIVEYLNKHLDPARMAQVRKRLDDDPAFRDLAAPLILTWSLPKHLERYPRPAGELEKDWDEFTKRAGFAHQKRKTRRRRLWLLGISLFIVGAGLLPSAVRRPLSDWYVTQRHYVAVASMERDGWIHLGDSLFVDPAPGASLRASREPVQERLHVILDGEARFRVVRRDSITPTRFHRGLVVRTRAGTATTDEGEFTVTARSDSTVVEVHRPSTRTYFWFWPNGTGVHLRSADFADSLAVGELGRARLVRGKGQHPTRLPPAKEPRHEISIP